MTTMAEHPNVSSAPVRLIIDRELPSGARTGRLITPHGEIPTPTFMPCASWATVRACSPDDVAAVGITMMVCNGFHLSVRPGASVIEQAGGLHRFMGWAGPLATDSGGFQVLSLSGPEQVNEDGVTIRSPVDGQLTKFTPELAVEVQARIGADVAVALDICPPYPVTEAEAREALDRTLRWAERCLAAHKRPDQALWGVVQGSVFPHLRRKSARATAQLGFHGFGIGGLSVGETKTEMLTALQAAVSVLPRERPRWLMGVGTPRDIVQAAAYGVDVFDCVLPTRMARHGSVLTRRGVLKIGNAACKSLFEPIDPTCDCPACRHTVAYLHHLFRLGEAAAWRLLSLHNLRFYARLMDDLRQAIAADALDDLLASLPRWTRRDEESPAP